MDMTWLGPAVARQAQQRRGEPVPEGHGRPPYHPPVLPESHDRRPRQHGGLTHQAVDVLTSRGDQLLYQADPEVASVLVWALATLLVHTTGGVTAFGHHWCDQYGGPCADPDCRNSPGGPQAPDGGPRRL